jgi:hypothetical protein
MDRSNEPFPQPGERPGANGYNVKGTGVDDGREGSRPGDLRQIRVASRIRRARKMDGPIVDLPEWRGCGPDDGSHWYGVFKCGDEIARLIKLHPELPEQAVRDWISRELVDAALGAMFGDDLDPPGNWVDDTFRDLLAKHEQALSASRPQ